MIPGFGFFKIWLLDILRQFQYTGFDPDYKPNMGPKKSKRWGKGKK